MSILGFGGDFVVAESAAAPPTPPRKGLAGDRARAADLSGSGVRKVFAVLRENAATVKNLIERLDSD